MNGFDGRQQLVEARRRANFLPGPLMAARTFRAASAVDVAAGCSGSRIRL